MSFDFDGHFWVPWRRMFFLFFRGKVAIRSAAGVCHAFGCVGNRWVSLLRGCLLALEELLELVQGKIYEDLQGIPQVDPDGVKATKRQHQHFHMVTKGQSELTGTATCSPKRAVFSGLSI